MKQRFQSGNAIFEVALKSQDPIIVEIQSGEDRSVTELEFHNSRDLVIDGQRFPIRVSRQGLDVWVSVGAHTFKFTKTRKSRSSQEVEATFTAPMPGKIVKLGASVGETVEEGQVLVVMEAMKMEHAMIAPSKGTVEAFHFAPGDLVPLGAELLQFVAAEV